MGLLKRVGLSAAAIFVAGSLAGCVDPERMAHAHANCAHCVKKQERLAERRQSRSSYDPVTGEDAGDRFINGLVDPLLMFWGAKVQADAVNSSQYATGAVMEGVGAANYRERIRKK